MVKRELTELQTIQFLELLAKMASNATFERILDLSPGEVLKHKKALDIESPDEARLMAEKLKKAHGRQRDIDSATEIKQVREAERIANQRLADLEKKKLQEKANKPKRELDVTAIRQEAAERQRNWTASQETIEEPEVAWRLPEESDASIAQFRTDIVNHGFAFLFKKYGASRQQIRFEANRLKLKINWDIVRR